MTLRDLPAILWAVIPPLVLVALVWRVLNPDVLVNMGTSGVAYLALSCSFAVLVGILGWFGAKMTFPH